MASIVYSPKTFQGPFCVETEAILFPHPLEEETWKELLPILEDIQKNIPIFFSKKSEEMTVVRKSSKVMRQSVFLDATLDFEEMALLIRDVIQKNTHLRENHLECGPFLLNRLQWTLEYKDHFISFNKKEFFLFELFLQNLGRVTTRDSIVRHVWDKRQYVAANTIDVYVSRLRKKLKDLSEKPHIETIPCLGYMLTVH